MLIIIKVKESVVADEDYRLSIGLFASYLGDFDSWSAFSHNAFAFIVSYLRTPLFLQESGGKFLFC